MTSQVGFWPNEKDILADVVISLKYLKHLSYVFMDHLYLN